MSPGISSSVKFATAFAIIGLHDPAGEGKKKPDRAVKYRGPQGEVWTAVGAMAGWLKKLWMQVKILKGFGFSLVNATLSIIC